MDWSAIVACSPHITSETKYNVTQVPVGVAGLQMDHGLAKSYIADSITSQKLLFKRANSNYSDVLVSLQILEDEHGKHGCMNIINFTLFIILYFLFSCCTYIEDTVMQLRINATATPCIGTTFCLTCTSSRSPSEYSSSHFSWSRDGKPLLTYSSSRYESSNRGENVADLKFVLDASDIHAVYSCGLPGCSHSNNYTISPLSKSPFCQ